MNWQDWIKNKKFTFFTAETLPSMAGFGVNAIRYATSLKNMGAEPKLVCYNYNNKNTPFESIGSVAIHRTRYYNKNCITKILSVPILVYNYFRQVKNSDIVLIYGKYLVGYELIILFSAIFRKPCIFRSTLLGEDDLESIRKQSKFLWPVRKFLFSKLTCYFAINGAFSIKYRNYFPKSLKIFESYQGVDVQRFANTLINKNYVRNNYSIPQNHIVFLSCGILIERKGYRELFTALSQLNYPFTYIIAGQFEPSVEHKSDAREQAEMNALISFGRKILKEKVIFAGIIENIENYMRGCDIFLHNATAEGTPNVILEAMAAGIPVVCRKTEGVSGTLLVDGKNCIQFSDFAGLCSIAKDIPYRYNDLKNFAGVAQKSIVENYTFEKVTERFAKWLMGTSQ